MSFITIIIIGISILSALIALPPAIESILNLIDRLKVKGEVPENEPPRKNVHNRRIQRSRHGILIKQSQSHR